MADAQLQRVLKAVRRRAPDAEAAFMKHCRSYGKCGAVSIERRAAEFNTFLVAESVLSLPRRSYLSS